MKDTHQRFHTDGCSKPFVRNGLLLEGWCEPLQLGVFTELLYPQKRLLPVNYLAVSWKGGLLHLPRERLYVPVQYASSRTWLHSLHSRAFYFLFYFIFFPAPFQRRPLLPSQRAVCLIYRRVNSLVTPSPQFHYVLNCYLRITLVSASLTHLLP